MGPFSQPFNPLSLGGGGGFARYDTIFKLHSYKLISIQLPTIQILLCVNIIKSLVRKGSETLLDRNNLYTIAALYFIKISIKQKLQMPGPPGDMFYTLVNVHPYISLVFQGLEQEKH